MMRSVWSGSISVGLINIPVKAYTATRSDSIGFNQLDKKGHKINHKNYCPVCKKDVPYNEIQKGYKVAKDKWVIIEKADIEGLKLKTEKAIEVQSFIDATDVDNIYIAGETLYFAPEEGAEKVYKLFLEVLSVTNKMAVGKWVYRGKEKLIAVRVYKGVIAVQVLRYKDEVVSPEQMFPELAKVEVKPAELKLAIQLIDSLAGKFDQFKDSRDRYTEELKKLVAAKTNGQTYTVNEEVKSMPDLVEALKATITEAKKKKVAVKAQC